MNTRSPRHASPRTHVAPLHRGPQAISSPQPASVHHAPNAALLIDFDNVTMGIRSDLAGELRSLLSSEIIKGKVAVQRAYADWRRYPQYIVPLAESSIDMIMAPAYGSSKKNATDIRLAVDAMELVFTRPEIGTYILLSGDSDFASLVTKLKEYGKYVIGVGIRESSSDLLVMNCDEYYSYNALAGLVKSGDEETVKWDPWELVVEAITRMTKNGDVMRSDRLKQVMQDIDATFDEKNLGMAKFSRFVQEAQTRGLLSVTKLENGQLEVGPTNGKGRTEESKAAVTPSVADDRGDRGDRGDRDERGGRRGRRGRGGRDRNGGDRNGHGDRPRERTGEHAVERSAEHAADRETPRESHRDERREPRRDAESSAQTALALGGPAPAAAHGGRQGREAHSADEIGRSGERLTKDEAFDLVVRAARALIHGDDAVLASQLRKRAFELLGRDSESLSERLFVRILKDAHDGEVIDLRRRGDDYEVALPAAVAPVAEQLNRASQARSGSAPAAPAGAPPVVLRGMGPRGIPARGRAGAAPPPELLSIGVVEPVSHPPAVAASEPEVTVEPPAAAAKRVRGGTRGGRSRAKTAARAAPSPVGNEATDGGAAAAKPAAKKRGRSPRTKAKDAS